MNRIKLCLIMLLLGMVSISFARGGGGGHGGGGHGGDHGGHSSGASQSSHGDSSRHSASAFGGKDTSQPFFVFPQQSPPVKTSKID